MLFRSPGKPQVWYLDLFSGRNDHEAVRRAGPGGHKEINRTNLSKDRLEEEVGKSLFRDQVELLRFRSSFPAFDLDADIRVEAGENTFRATWEKDGCAAALEADLSTCRFTVTGTKDGEEIFRMER